MENLASLLTLDAKGILPEDGESESAYLFRGYRSLTLALDQQWLKEFTRRNLRKVAERKGFQTATFPAIRNKKTQKFLAGLHAFKGCTGTDVTWVPTFSFTDNSASDFCAGIRVEFETASGIPMYFFGVNGNRCPSPQGTAMHEAFHLIRTHISRGDDREYEHCGHLIWQYFRRWDPTSKAEWDFLQAWLLLYWHFRRNAWYVFSRLRYEEVQENILHRVRGRNPQEYLRHAASFRHNLRHRIMCHRLGLPIA